MLLLVWILYVCVIGIHAAANRDHPVTIKTYENETVLLPCYVEGAETRVRWWRDVVLLADSFEQERPSSEHSERITLYSNGSLRVHHVQREDSGEYVCQVIRPSPWGHVTQVHEIEVQYPPSAETVPASGELEVNLGERVEMQCVTKGVPAPVISWMTKDEELPLLDARPQLRFHADDRNLSGRYTCIADNGIGDPAVAHVDLRIRYRPEIYVKKPWVHAFPGLRVQLGCTVTAWPEAKVEWYFNNETLKYTSRIAYVVMDNALNDHLLLIKDLETTDYGSYLCRASNSLGITEKIIELSGIANPAVFKKESRSTSATSYRFIWVVDSYSPIIQYQFWFRKYGSNAGWCKLNIPAVGNDVVSPVHVGSFNLTGLAAATYYEAVVLSRNRHGWSHPSEILRFHTEGARPVNPSENSKMDGNQQQYTVSGNDHQSKSEQLTANTNGSPYNQAQALSLTLGMLSILIITTRQIVIDVV